MHSEAFSAIAWASRENKSREGLSLCYELLSSYDVVYRSPRGFLQSQFVCQVEQIVCRVDQRSRNCVANHYQELNKSKYVCSWLKYFKLLSSAVARFRWKSIANWWQTNQRLNALTWLEIHICTSSGANVLRSITGRGRRDVVVESIMRKKNNERESRSESFLGDTLENLPVEVTRHERRFECPKNLFVKT